MPLEERTNDHIIPRSKNGETEIKNIVICCQDCNGLKGSTEINAFLKEYPEKKECFYNYLNMIEYQSGSSEYSNAIVEQLAESYKKAYSKKKLRAKAKRQRRKMRKQAERQTEMTQQQLQNIEYKIESTGQSFCVSQLQSEILDYYLEHPDFSNHKKLAKELSIGNDRLIREINCINNLTGLFKLKKVSENGVVLNNLYDVEIIKC